MFCVQLATFNIKSCRPSVNFFVSALFFLQNQGNFFCVWPPIFTTGCWKLSVKQIALAFDWCHAKLQAPNFWHQKLEFRGFFFFHLYITNIYLKQEQTRKHFSLDVKLSVPKVGPQILKGVFFFTSWMFISFKDLKKLIVLWFQFFLDIFIVQSFVMIRTRLEVCGKYLFKFSFELMIYLYWSHFIMFYRILYLK